MAAALVLLPQILALIPTAVVGIEHLIAWSSSIRAAAQQSGEWTPDLESAYVAALEARAQQPQYQPDVH